MSPLHPSARAARATGGPAAASTALDALLADRELVRALADLADALLRQGVLTVDDVPRAACTQLLSHERFRQALAAGPYRERDAWAPAATRPMLFDGLCGEDSSCAPLA